MSSVCTCIWYMLNTYQCCVRLNSNIHHICYFGIRFCVMNIKNGDISHRGPWSLYIKLTWPVTWRSVRKCQYLNLLQNCSLGHTVYSILFSCLCYTLLLAYTFSLYIISYWIDAVYLLHWHCEKSYGVATSLMTKWLHAVYNTVNTLI